MYSRRFSLPNSSNDELKEKNRRIAELVPIPLLYMQNVKKSPWSLLRSIFKEKKFMKEIEEVEERSIENRSKRVLVKQSSVTSFKPKTRRPMRRYTAESFEDVVFISILRNDYNALVRALQVNTIDVNYMRPPGLTPLHQACVVGNLKIVRTLILHGADTKLRTWSNLTPLLIANLFGHFDVALFLINQGACTRDIQNGFSFDLKLALTVTDQFESMARRGSCI